ncbi:hypothetical protein HMPREF2857_09935 [Corynebacterium sp. HMSC076C10]|nr:hypothetical protein HMPREF2857_09935 [Corynebacterium sp. HMSC076C10]OFU61091.1 hypothetical protein HMPREF3135_05625 [Corynebacterium sp. HMSC14H10]
MFQIPAHLCALYSGESATESEEKLAKFKSLSKTTIPDLTIIAGVGSLGGSPSEVSDDLRLIRSGLLYADHISVLSLGTTLLHQFLRLNDLDDTMLIAFFFNQMFEAGALSAEQMEQFERVFDVLEQIESQKESVNRKTWRKGPQFAEQRKVWNQLHPILREMTEGVRRNFNDMWKSAGGEEIDAAEKAGILTFDDEWTNELYQLFESDNLKTKAEFLAKSLNTSGSAILMDPMMHDLYKAMHNEGHLNIPKFRKDNIRTTKLGTQMTISLPNLSEAPVPVILDVRNQIEPRLHQYRQSVKSLNTKLHEEIFSENLDEEIEQLWFDDVLPHVQELEMAVYDSRLGAVKDGVIAASKGAAGLAANGALMFTVANIEQLTSSPLMQGASLLGSAVAGLPLTKKGMDSGIKSFQERQNRKKEAKKDGLFYLANINRVGANLN